MPILAKLGLGNARPWLRWTVNPAGWITPPSGLANVEHRTRDVGLLPRTTASTIPYW